MTERSPPLPAVIRLLAFSAGLAAANIHYSQPLLPNIAATLGAPIDRIGLLPATTQVGFALGILAVLPLADMLERRRLIVTMLCLSAAGLALQAAAPSTGVAFLGAFLIGLFGVTPQLMTPFAAILAPKGREGAAVGFVLSGVLVGVLLSKVLAGLVTVGLGWRALFGFASAAMLVLAATLSRILPQSRAERPLPYLDLLRSTVALARDEPALRRHALNGGLTFASFMTFWSTYAVELKQALGYDAGVAGLFGFIGLAGAAAASIAGRQIDRGRFALTSAVASGAMILGFVLLGFGGTVLAPLVLGVLAMDFGAGLSHAGNQSSAFALRPEARGRINSVYMSGYFIGGAIGASLATLVYAAWGWRMTMALGALWPAIMLALELAAPLGAARSTLARRVG